MGYEYKRILVCNNAHIGDMILTTAVLPVLKSAYPEASLGVLVGSGSLPVVENHTHIDWVHTFDHPQHDRSARSKKSKKRRGSHSWQQALISLKEKEYDLAFDMYSLYRQNVGSLLHRAQIPTRVGFWYSPASFYFNHHVFWCDSVNKPNAHVIEIHEALLRGFGIEERHLAHLKPTLTYRTEEKKPELPSNYIVVHMGVGEKKREWNLASWKELVMKLETLGLPLVFVGRGKREKELIEETSEMVKNKVNLCDKVSWRELLPLMKEAKLLVGLESMAGHMAAAFQIPSVLVYGGTAFIHRWRPYSPYSYVATPPEHLFKNNNAPPDAIHQITASDVFEKVKLALSR